MGIDVADAAGKRIDSQETMTTADLRVLTFGRPLPADSQLRISVATARSLATAPLRLRDVSLP